MFISIHCKGIIWNNNVIISAIVEDVHFQLLEKRRTKISSLLIFREVPEMMDHFSSDQGDQGDPWCL